MPILQLINVLQVSHLKHFRMLILTTYNELDRQNWHFSSLLQAHKSQCSDSKKPAQGGFFAL